MPTYGVNQVNRYAQPVWYGSADNPKPFTITNNSTNTATNIWIGPNSSAGPTAPPDEVTEISQGGYLSLDGTWDVYYVSADGPGGQVQILPGVTSFFLPTNLVSIGGVKVFVQGTTPVGTIPTNSLWFNTSNGEMLVFTAGMVWVQQQFSGNQLIQATSILAGQIANGTLTTTQLAAAAGILGGQIANATITGSNIAANTIVAGNIAANTITASQLAAGIIYAGIVNGTEIDGSIFRATNASGATILTVNKTSGTWFLYVDTGSATQGALAASAVASSSNVTDEFGNVALPGLTAYGQAMSGTWVACNYGVNNSAFGVLYYTASSEAGPWTLDSWLRRSGASTGQLEAGPIVELLSTSLLPSTPSAGAKLWTPNTTNTPRVMKPDGEPGYGIGETIYVLPGSAQSITAGWAVTIAGGGVSLSVPVVSGVQYYFEFIIEVQTPTINTNTLVGVTGPTTSQCEWYVHTQLGTTNPLTGAISTGFQASLTHVGMNFSAVNEVGIAHAWGTFTPSANGTFAAAAGENNAIAFNVLPGTYLLVRTTH